MPLIYRVMKVENGRPKVGAASSCLGARVGEDIQPDQDGNVHPGTGGMSVVADPNGLPDALVPVMYRSFLPHARSKDTNRRIWKMGQGPFVSGPIADALEFRVDPKHNEHGFVEPGKVMPISGYQGALAATRDKWDEVKA
ncbi:MAG: hypothetical protein ABSE73_32765 [Planctomycetota bacterium]